MALGMRCTHAMITSCLVLGICVLMSWRRLMAILDRPHAVPSQSYSVSPRLVPSQSDRAAPRNVPSQSYNTAPRDAVSQSDRAALQDVFTQPKAPPISTDVENGVFYGDLCGLERFVKKVSSGQNVSIVTIGSSLTAGVGVEPPDRVDKSVREQHRYSTLLERNLRKQGAHIQVTTQAKGACPSSCWINSLHYVNDHQPDLILAEMNVDAEIGGRDAEKYFRQLIVEFFVLRLPVMFWIAGGPKSSQHLSLREAEVPFYSYFQQYWFPKGTCHPNRETHTHIASGLARALQLVVQRFNRVLPVCSIESFFSKPLFGKNISGERCSEPITDLRSSGPSDKNFPAKAKLKNSIWVYRSDSLDKSRHDKYGWIAETAATEFPEFKDLSRSQIGFEIDVGNKRRVDITFLRTYNNIGGIHVNAIPMTNPGSATTAAERCIDGLWEYNFSSISVVTMHLTPGRWRLDFTLLPLMALCSPSRVGKAPWHFRKILCKSHNWCKDADIRAQKFKLISVASC